jgi:lipoate-protein ligase A
MNVVPQGRLLPHTVDDGPGHMATDVALLDAVDERPESAVLRTYEWSSPTLSLGYFQSFGEVANSTRWAGLPVVRRPSGGGALMHDRELTYALIVPRSHPLAGRPSALYRAVHGAIAEALNARSVSVRRRGENDASTTDTRPFLCFEDRDVEDLLIGRSKVVGSAQRRRPRAVLQHGSILLARSEWTPELPGIQELGPMPIEMAHLRLSVIEAVGRALGVAWRSDDLRGEERRAADDLRSGLFADPAWTGRR